MPSELGTIVIKCMICDNDTFRLLGTIRLVDAQGVHYVPECICAECGTPAVTPQSGRSSQ